jgi:tight adherence protein B
MMSNSIILYIAFVSAFFGAIQGLLYFSADIRAETKNRWSQIRRPTLADGVSPWLRDILLSTPIRRFDNLVTTCGIKMATENVMLAMTVLVVILMSLLEFYVELNAILAMLVSAIFGIGLPLFALTIFRNRRMGKLTAQLPETLDMIVRSLKAGHPIPVAVGLVAKDMAQPIGTEFKLAHDTMAFGLDLREALMRMSERLHTVPELRYVVSAIRIQATSGGNLAEVLASVSKLMRESHKLKMKVKAISAEGRMSGNILAAVPILVVVVLNIITPSYYRGAVENKPLLFVLGFAASLVASGIFLIRRITTIRV